MKMIVIPRVQIDSGKIDTRESDTLSEIVLFESKTSKLSYKCTIFSIPLIMHYMKKPCALFCIMYFVICTD